MYHGLYLVPFHQPISAHVISSPNCHWNVSLPSGASPWNSIFWGRVEGQNITIVCVCFFSLSTLCIVINFLVFESILPSFSLVHFRNGSEYITRETVPLMRFLRRSLVSKIFHVRFLLFFLSYLHFWWCPLPIFPSTWKFPFLRTF